MTVRVYASTDSSAPSLDGTAGSLINLLDKVLVSGYGAKTAAGWTKPYTGTNKAAFRAAAGNQRYLRVDDSGTTNARVVGYESMSDVDTGSGPFPTAAQQSGGAYLIKSSTANSTARPWLCVANGSIFHLFTYPYETTLHANVERSPGLTFGDYTSYKSGDAYNTIIIAQPGSGQNDNYHGRLEATINSATSGHWGPRSWTQTGSAVTLGKTGEYERSGQAGTMGLANLFSLTFPDPVSGAFNLAPLYIHQNADTTVRGVLPGVWQPLHTTGFVPGDTFSGTGELAGRTFLVVYSGNLSSKAIEVIETSDTW